MSANTTVALSSRLGHSLSANFERVRRRVHTLVDPVAPEDIWRRPFPFGNSVGHLLLHLTGNLSYYIGAQIAGTGYVRDRPREFADPTQRPKDDILRDFDRAVDMVLATLGQQGEADWSAPYSAEGKDDVPDRLGIFLHCLAHADHHAGQIIYLCKQIEARAAGR